MAEAGWVALCCALGLAAALAILLPPYPPLQDFPEWAWQGDLLARILGGESLPGLSLATWPVPNSSVQAMLGLLSLALPAAVAAKAFLLALVAAAVALALALGWRYQPQAPGAFAAVLLVAVFLHAGFWNGYANYQLGLLLLGAWFLLPEARRGQALPILAFSLLIFFTHAMVFAAFGLLLGLSALLRWRLLPTILGLLPAAALTLWYLAAGAGGQATEARSLGGVAAFLGYKAYTLAKLGPYHNFVFATGGDAALRPALHWGGAAANALFAAGLGLALLLGLQAAWRDRRLAWPALLAAGLLLAGFAVLPDLVQNVVNPGERLLLPALLILLLVLPLPALLLRGLGLGAILLLGCVLLLATTRQGWDRPLHFTELDPARTELFRHRPTAFACKWAALRDGAQPGMPGWQPLSFATSLLLGPTQAGCTGRPG
ncbi:hypothetical protein CKO45_11420 [Paracraurococcus ruber]|uniref:Uncharacterized protein n=2 Tax=Paracraurococcus ruber TaxID=77675 RepID=A0ABS1CWE9_9PROT|nr:hypothetical protein [Paracraurococcus ruber]